MKITGYQLREAIKVWQLRKTAAEAAFTDSLTKFKDEVKEEPAEVAERLVEAETAIVRLQVAQARYNLAVLVSVAGIPDDITLAEVIKLAGATSRIEKVWSGATSTLSMNTRHSYGVRDPNHDHAKASITPKDILERTSALTKRAGALRAALGAGNTREVDIENLDAAYLA